MKAYKYILMAIAGLGLTACDSESPFTTDATAGEGQLNAASINLKLDLDESIKVRSRAEDNDDLLKDFNVYFLNSIGQSVKDYKYGEMPEVVTLPAGSYTVKAIYGEDLAAQWDNPYFVGESKQFDIKANKITTDVEPVTCSLQNVMVSVVFDKELMEHITGEPQVEVYVNTTGSLIYKKEHSDNKKPGYFKHDKVNTLTAEFNGTVDGVELKEIKTLNDIQPGNHYRLTFYRHVYTGDESGEIEADIAIDAKVTVNDLSANVTLEEETPLTDVTWPNQSGDNKDENQDPKPEDPEDPNTPDEPNENVAPTIVLDPKSTVEIGKVNDVNENDVVIMKVHSDTGITKFDVDIISENLHLSDLGADSDSLDLVNPGKTLEMLQILGILKEGQTSLKGEKDVDFDITGFMEMLCAVNGEHHFVVTVGDDNGETSVTLILNVP